MLAAISFVACLLFAACLWRRNGGDWRMNCLFSQLKLRLFFFVSLFFVEYERFVRLCRISRWICVPEFRASNVCTLLHKFHWIWLVSVTFESSSKCFEWICQMQRLALAYPENNPETGNVECFCLGPTVNWVWDYFLLSTICCFLVFASLFFWLNWKAACKLIFFNKKNSRHHQML